MQSIHVANLLQIFAYCLFTFIFAIAFYPKFIQLIRKYKLTQKIRSEGLSGGKLMAMLHAHKKGTPTMGGIIIIAAVFVTVAFSRGLAYFGVIDYSLLNRGETYLPLATLLFVGVLGVIDDYLNITEKSKHKGLSVRVKFWSLFLFAVIGAIWFTFKLEYSLLHIPGIGDFDIGYWYAPLFIFILVGVSNSVNLTDGLDGLAGGLLVISYGVFGAIAYFYGLPILATFCMVIVAALLAFLWFNVPPASVYMGDTGSLALGATLGVIALMTNAVLILAVVGLVFVLETVSVMLQLFWKKKFKRKLFHIAPLHHHFEKVGWSETQIVMRFWLLGAVCGVMGLILGLLGMGLNGILQ